MMTDDQAAQELGLYIQGLENLVLIQQEASRLRAEESLLMMARMTELTRAINDMNQTLASLVQQLILSGVIQTPDLRGRTYLT